MQWSKLIGLWLGVGGILGIKGFFKLYKVFAETRAKLPPRAALITSLFFLFLLALGLALFSWSAWTGLELWRGTPQAYKWARTIFILQIPVMALPGFDYGFCTGVKLWFALNLSHPGRVDFELDFATESVIHLNIRLGKYKVKQLVLGANLPAVAGLIGLIKIWPV